MSESGGDRQELYVFNNVCPRKEILGAKIYKEMHDYYGYDPGNIKANKYKPLLDLDFWVMLMISLEDFLLVKKKKY